ncbi:MAG: hypothetical protein PHY83_02225 [Bacilli bacterium]|nr:hypothetical protein [Bacilli bacterium]
MNKKIYGLFIAFLLLLFFSSFHLSTKAANDEEIMVHFFHTTTCYNCGEEEKHLNSLPEEYNLKIIYYTMDDEDNTKAQANKELFYRIAEVFDIEKRIITPFTVIGGKSFIGFNENIKSEMIKYIEKYQDVDFVDVVQKVINNETIDPSDIEIDEESYINIPLFGRVDVKSFSILLIAIVMGFVDGVNPCAMWILIFLITMLIPTGNKKKIWLFGGVFLLVSAIFYFIVMMAWIKTVELIAAKQIFIIIIGAFALGAGGYNIYRYIKSSIKQEDGCDVTNPTQRRKISNKIRKIINEKSIFIALIGIITLAIMVNFIELACSAGLPVLFSQILAINDVSSAQELIYVLIYVLFFLLDDLIIFAIATFSLKAIGISNKFAKYSHLIGGILMLIIGILLLFFPNIIMFNF